MKKWKAANETSIGHVDLLGNYHVFLRDFHVDPFNNENLGFFKRISYNDKLKEYNESLL